VIPQTVFCDDPSHSRWDIGVYHYDADDVVWRPDESLRHAASTLQRLDPDNMKPGTIGPERRWRYRFECNKCGMVLVVRAEKVLTIFNTLAEAGLTEISLGGIARVTT
jgi:hypothetical protein